MTKSYSLEEMMDAPLPSIAYQKRLMYRTNYSEVTTLYRQLNYYIFDEELTLPIIEVAPRCRQYWGICYGAHEKKRYKRSLCKIRLMDKWFCKQWLITTLAHEMCHQYQWDIIGEKRIEEGKDRLMSHGPSFFLFRDRLAEYGIPLKTSHRQKHWLKYQNIFKC
jgi:hypothetical protein